MTTSESHRETTHPTQGKYVAIALVLAAITIVEVAIVYLQFLAGVLVPTLMVLSVVKFALVAMFFMHLKFDHRLFSTMFVVGVLLATGILIALLALFRVIFSG
jgi:cytochrome c oxidase subunit 4